MNRILEIGHVSYHHTVNVIADGGGSNLFPPGLDATFTQSDIDDRIYGSKIVVVSEQAMLNVIYTIKACMLLMYTRLTLGLRDGRMVRWLAAYVATGWFATELAFFTACRPFSGYWALPPPDPQCTTLANYAIVQASFNISSDILMLGIPIPLIVRMKLPWRQKIVLVFIFSLGVFVVIAALLTKIFNLTNVYSPGYMLWYVREASVAVYVSNLPMIWPLLREWFPSLKYMSPGFGRSRYTGAGAKKSRRNKTARYGESQNSTIKLPTGARMASDSTFDAPELHRKASRDAYDDDIEMAMAVHGVGIHDKDASASDEEELKPKSWRGRERIASPGPEEKGWPFARLQNARRAATASPESLTDSDPDFRLMKMEDSAKQKVIKGIQVHTVVEVREEQASPAAQTGRGQAMW